MYGATSVLRSGLLVLGFALPLAAARIAAAAEGAPAPSGEAKPQAADGASSPGDKAKPELSPELAALRDQVRRTLAVARRTPMNTRDNTATDLMLLATAFGCDAEVQLGGAGGQPINAITCLCWNYPCAGREPLAKADGHIAARIGYGLQTQRGQLLAVLAQARVPDDYPVRVGEDKRTVADLVQYEKLQCRAGVDQSQALIGLAFYVKGDATWTNGPGETWSLERLVDQELEGPIAGAPDGGLGRLMALACAVRARKAQKLPESVPYAQAEQYLRRFHEHAFKCQNADGSWNPAFFAAVGPSRDTPGVLRATGMIADWLAQSLPDDQIEDPRMVKAVSAVNGLVSSVPSLGGARAASPIDTAALMHAVRALATYDDRVFASRGARPASAAEGPAAAKPAAK